MLCRTDLMALYHLPDLFSHQFLCFMLLSALVIPHLHQTKLPSSLVNFLMHTDIQID